MPITRRQFLWGIGAGATGGAAGLAWWNRDPAATHSQSGHALGTQVAITVRHPRRDIAERALAAAFAEIELVEQVLSLYRPDSQLVRLNRDGVLVETHAYLRDVLTTAAEMSRRTGGAFDVTVQPLWQLHADAAKAGRSPSDDELAAAVHCVDWQRVELSPGEVRLNGPGTAVTLNGIAQGFAGDRALAALRAHGIEHALVDAGELAGLGAKPDGQPWRVGVQHPRHEDAFISLVDLRGRCLATSGDYATRFGSGDDFLRHHLFDPRTGRSPTDFASVSILAPTGMLADSLSTAVFVLGLERGTELVRTTPDVDAFFVRKDGRTWATPGFTAVG